MNPSNRAVIQAHLTSRRGFWRGLLGEAMRFHEEVRGIAQCSLGDIDKVPGEVVAEMTPVWMDGREPDIRDDGVYRTRKGGDVVCVKILAPCEHAMLAQYDGGKNLRAIARRVARDHGLAEEEAFAAARSLFVRLCQAGFCHPAAAHEDA
ncbi:MAG: hypothetical protein LBT74_03285 [Acidobacteriota bacterium]|jgi:hypothetical protein|nr:hypothetical protein [Acidobacteriota bacterium]